MLIPGCVLVTCFCPPQAQVTTSGYMNTLTAILNRVTSALTARAQNAGRQAGGSGWSCTS
jgi:hypothetical protein